MSAYPFPPFSRRWRRQGAAAAAAVALAVLAGCASSSAPGAAPADAATPAGATRAPSAAVAPRIQVPPTSVGTWYDLGHVLAPWLAGDAPVAVNGATAPTRVAGLRREDGRWLAIVLVQTAPAGSAPCPAPTSVDVPVQGSDGCLRLRRNADFDGWLQRQHAQLYQWLDARGRTAPPRAWAAYRLPAAGNRLMEVHVLVDTALLEPATRSNADFLSGGQPGNQWALALAAATQAAAGSDVLNVPPFPFAPALAAPAPPAAVPASATQVPPAPPTPPAPPPMPQRDRE